MAGLGVPAPYNFTIHVEYDIGLVFCDYKVMPHICSNNSIRRAGIIPFTRVGESRSRRDWQSSNGSQF